MFVFLCQVILFLWLIYRSFSSEIPNYLCIEGMRFMTKDELSQIYYLNCEVIELQKKIAEINDLANSCSTKVTGLTDVCEISKITSMYNTEISDLKELLNSNLKKCLFELKKMNQFIQNIDDSQMRLILAYRYIDRLTWQQIAFRIGESDEQYPRKKHNAFLKKYKLDENNETELIE